MHIVSMFVAGYLVSATAPAEPPDLSGAMSYPCALTYESGMVLHSNSCETVESALCCSYSDWVEGEGCPTSCVCEWTEEREVDVVEEFPALIRGVPVLYQFDTQPGDSVEKPIGCGAVAVAQLMLWYHQLGWTDLAEDYKVAGAINWQSLTENLASNDYLSTWIRRNASPTYVLDMQSGIEAWIDDRGYAANVTHYRVKESGGDVGPAAAFGIIKQSILQGRPVVIGYDTSPTLGGGIGGGGDDFGWINHYGLVVGVNDTDGKTRVLINAGLGTDRGDAGVNSYDWQIGDGSVHLWLVEMTASEKDPAAVDCPMTDWATQYTPIGDVIIWTDGTVDPEEIGVTFEDSSYDSYPLVTRFIAGDTCDLVGGDEVTSELRDVTIREEADCTPRYDVYQTTYDGEGDLEPGDWGGIGDELNP
ncbi:MAG: hypothetical protein ACI9OJ_001689 [Myxococcota bacterium]|jgi:hypothetical protein